MSPDLYQERWVKFLEWERKRTNPEGVNLRKRTRSGGDHEDKVIILGLGELFG
jgi:hypothetical protein